MSGNNFVWSDAEGVPILVGVTVRQIGVHPSRGALVDRCGQEAVVIGRGASRLLVRFAADGVERTIHPLMVRVVSAVDPADHITLEQVIGNLQRLLRERDACGNAGDACG